MFGYVIVNKQELRIREFYQYRSYYCGLCRSLQGRCGIRGQMSLSYDMTFLAMLLSCLYEPAEEERLTRCVAHPMQKQLVKKNETIDYVADMTLLLAWYKCKDDFQDEKKVGKALYSRTIERQVKQITQMYGRQAEAIKMNLERILDLEQEGNTDIDELSGSFGHSLEEIFVMRQDEWQKYLRNIGFYIGKFVYIIDAYDDLGKDRKRGCFNPFLEKEREAGFDEWVKQLLTMAAVGFAKEFEKLPVIENVEILRNIIYSGIWIKYEEVKEKRRKDMEEQNEKSL